MIKIKSVIGYFFSKLEKTLVDYLVSFDCTYHQ